MTNKTKLWNQALNWEEAEKQWDTGSEKAAKEHPLKMLKSLPKMPGICEDTQKNLRWKAFKYMVQHDHDRGVMRGFLRHPLKYSWAYLKSLFRKESFGRDDDFFLYNVSSVETFKERLGDPHTVFVVGFSYCHKPHECPSGRFTDQCIHDPDHPVCRQCFIGKSVNTLPEHPHIIPLFIPTVHYIGSKIFEIAHRYPDKQVLFLITACELTLEMFGDWGNMAGIQGLGVRLDGRICNTMRAFELSEKGIKPGLTVVLDHTQKRVLDILRRLRERQQS